MDKKDLKIVFLGTPEFAVESLSRLVEGGYNVAAVVTMTDKPGRRGAKVLESDVKKYAVAHGLPVLQPSNLKDPEFVQQLRDINADLFIVIAFRMLPEVVWTMPRLGTFNLHASLLPRYRGAAPINHAVMNGDSETGVTTFMLKHEIDTGDILEQEKITIGPDENVGSVHDRLMHLGADLTMRTVQNILDGTLKPVPQSSLEAPTAAPKIYKETGNIDWTMPARRVHNLVRGLSPYPAAWSTMRGHGADPVEIKIMETRVVAEDGNYGAPGTVTVGADGSVTVACGQGAVQLVRVRPAGRREMDADAYMRGARFQDPVFTA